MKEVYVHVVNYILHMYIVHVHVCGGVGSTTASYVSVKFNTLRFVSAICVIFVTRGKKLSTGKLFMLCRELSLTPADIVIALPPPHVQLVLEKSHGYPEACRTYMYMYMYMGSGEGCSHLANTTS